MSRSVLMSALVILVASACAPKVPRHAGYKPGVKKPWDKAKAIKLKDNEGKIEGNLDYAGYRRARWAALELPSDGEVTVTLEQSPEGDGKIDVALEILDPNNKVISRADQAEEDAFEEEKTRTLYELRAGRYLVHLYLQGRLDKAAYELKIKFTPGSVEPQTDFPAQVAFVPDLPVVPIEDDTPKIKEPIRKPDTTRPPRPPRQPDPVEPPEPDGGGATGPINAKIINVVAVDGGVEITINRGTDNKVADGMNGRIAGLKNGKFQLRSCVNRSCKATVKATPDEVGTKGVTITP